MFTEAELEIFLTDENDNTPEFKEDFYELNVSEDLSGLEEDNNGHYLGKHIQSFFHIFKQRFMNEKVCKNIMNLAKQFFAQRYTDWIFIYTKKVKLLSVYICVQWVKS